MNSVELYNWTPALRVMATGLLLAMGPLCWVWLRHRQSGVAGRRRALVLLTLFLTFDLVLFGAFTRLTDSGLGCPDWPGCYGSVTPVGALAHIDAAQTAMPSGPVTHSKAWIEMIHRYLATAVGVLILTLAVHSWVSTLKHKDAGMNTVKPGWPTFTLLWVCLQGAFGAWTVTLKLFPAIVTLHLLGGLGLLALLCTQAVRSAGQSRTTLAPSLRSALLCVTVLVWLQISLGGWVSTNYAVLACEGIPLCNAQWWPAWDGLGFEVWRSLGHQTSGEILPFSALVSIHVVHRFVAVVVAIALLILTWRLNAAQVLPRQARWLQMLVLMQVLTGLSNVVLDWPLLAAVMHTGGAAALVVVLTWALTASQRISDCFHVRAPSAVGCTATRPIS
jgi:cytochrome c oxidase assembly protein subunit 15